MFLTRIFQIQWCVLRIAIILLFFFLEQIWITQESIVLRKKRNLEKSMSLEDLDILLASQPWTILVNRGHSWLPQPLADSVQYTYLFDFAKDKRILSQKSSSLRKKENLSTIKLQSGCLGIKTKFVDGKLIQGSQYSPVILNPFTIIYTSESTAILKTTALHYESSLEDCRITTNAPIEFECKKTVKNLKKGKEKYVQWILTGSMRDARAFWTPNQTFLDHFGWRATILGLASIGTTRIKVCATITNKEGELQEPQEYLQRAMSIAYLFNGQVLCECLPPPEIDDDDQSEGDQQQQHGTKVGYDKELMLSVTQDLKQKQQQQQQHGMKFGYDRDLMLSITQDLKQKEQQQQKVEIRIDPNDPHHQYDDDHQQLKNKIIISTEYPEGEGIIVS